jgi:hypothetical protein
MSKQEALELLEAYKNRLNLVELRDWLWLKTIINSLHEKDWKLALARAEKILVQ